MVKVACGICQVLKASNQCGACRPTRQEICENRSLQAGNVTAIQSILNEFFTTRGVRCYPISWKARQIWIWRCGDQAVKVQFPQFIQDIESKDELWQDDWQETFGCVLAIRLFLSSARRRTMAFTASLRSEDKHPSTKRD
jgi:hypothetical protein